MAERTATNDDMLMFRVMGEADDPGHNQDFLAKYFLSDRNKLLMGSALGRKLWRYFTEGKAPGVNNYVNLRTKWADSEVRKALDSGITQVVLVAAGFNTYAYRHHRRGARFFEVDLPHVVATKRATVDKLLPPRDYPRPTYVPADLSQTDLISALVGAGGEASGEAFDPEAPALFLVEGLVYYLPEPAVQSMLSSIASRAALGSLVCFDFLHRAALDEAAPGHGAYGKALKGTMAAVRAKGEPFLSAIGHGDDEAREYLAGCGLELASLMGPADILREFGAQEGKGKKADSWRGRTLPFYSYLAARVGDGAPAGEGGGEGGEDEEA